MTEYKLTNQMFGDGGIVTVEEAQELVDSWEPNADDEGWRYQVAASGDELRLYAYREFSETTDPGQHELWVMVTSDYGYIIIGERIEAL